MDNLFLNWISGVKKGTLPEHASLTNKLARTHPVMGPLTMETCTQPPLSCGCSPKWTENESKEKFKNPSDSPLPLSPSLQQSLKMWTFRSLNEFDKGEGTVTLVDSNSKFGCLLIFLASHVLKTKDDIVLVPQPSDDPNDPLNWSTYKKALAFGPIISFAFLGNWVVAGFGVALLLLIEEFQRDLNTTAQDLIGMPVLALGAGVFLYLRQCLYRISFGFHWLFILENVLPFSLLGPFSLRLSSGGQKPTISTVCWGLVFCRRLLLQPLRGLLPPLIRICFSSMNVANGWDITLSGWTWDLSLEVLCRASSFKI